MQFIVLCNSKGVPLALVNCTDKFLRNYDATDGGNGAVSIWYNFLPSITDNLFGAEVALGSIAFNPAKIRSEWRAPLKQQPISELDEDQWRGMVEYFCNGSTVHGSVYDALLSIFSAKVSAPSDFIRLCGAMNSATVVRFCELCHRRELPCRRAARRRAARRRISRANAPGARR